MNKKYSLGKYLFSLKNIIVAPKLLSAFHTVAQAVILIGALVVLIIQFRLGITQGALALLACVILVPLFSFIVRAYFELIMVPFSLTKNVYKIKKGLFGCECDGGCCGKGEFDALTPDEIDAIFAVDEVIDESVEPIKRHKIPTSEKKEKEIKKPIKEEKKADKKPAKPAKSVSKR